MRGRRFVLRLGLGALALATAVTAAPGVVAKRPLISVGEITTRAAGADVATEAALRELVARELDRLRLDRPGRDEAYVFSASLVRLQLSESHDGARATCVVSGILRRAASGAIVAMTEGRASAEDERSARQSVRVRAMEGAVHGAVRHVPEAF